ncbi:MAG: hypothetical protein GWO24_22970, partial [Akkermansiaceae bacterium]|nr:hypothetical protein [Akkermansiaceae bacterium]
MIGTVARKSALPPGPAMFTPLPRSLSIQFAIAAGFAAGPLGAANLLLNPGFDVGLEEWESAGSVQSSGGLAVLSDGGTSQSALYQVTTTTPGLHQLQFDFWNLTSTTVPEGTFPDTAFATLYLLEDPASFDPLAGTGFSESTDLLQADRDGEAVLASNGELTTATADPRLTTFS